MPPRCRNKSCPQMLLDACLAAGDRRGSPGGALGVPGVAWGLLPGPITPWAALVRPPSQVTSFPDAGHKLSGAPARQKARGSGLLEPPACHLPLHPWPLQLLVCLGQAGARCHLAQPPFSGALSPEGRSGLYSVVAPGRAGPLELVGAGTWYLLVTGACT